MTHVDDRTGPTRAKRSAGRSATRANARALNHGGDSRVAARTGRAVPMKDLSGAQLESEAERAERLAAQRAAAHSGRAHRSGHAGRSGRKKTKRSHAAVGAAIVAGAAMVATFAFILTNGNSSAPQGSGNSPLALAPQSSAPPAAKSTKANPAPAAVTTGKGDRKPPVPAKTSQRAATSNPPTSAAPNTGKASPVFKRGQWIAVMDRYPTDNGMDAAPLAKQLAGKMIAAGVPARAMMLNGQYTGLADSSGNPESDAWVVYLGPFSSSDAALESCQAPKTQSAYSSPACPTYEPAAKPG
ncbi:hypothetical protein AB0P21_09385 [Kribbella sp. NPDC056861]|uniref:hypothetical protein n=1 Tax=Kribbella sp. NPDC056861 TaxID=3154857 RepID=UPI0034129DFD